MAGSPWPRAPAAAPWRPVAPRRAPWRPVPAPWSLMAPRDRPMEPHGAPWSPMAPRARPTVVHAAAVCAQGGLSGDVLRPPKRHNICVPFWRLLELGWAIFLEQLVG